MVSPTNSAAYRWINVAEIRAQQQTRSASCEYSRYAVINRPGASGKAQGMCSWMSWVRREMQ